ncbi:MAG: hypothetical protein LBE27_06095 [Deltaproteobacteria bacterium]|jgi:hypothetical protein|nr:hypothetical protein [Deltaproteobacteria bacterium]
MPALLLTGAIIMIGGLVLFVVWFEYLWALIKALAPLAIIGVGAIVTYFGWEEKKDRSGAFLDFSSPSEASRYQAEALAYQEKLDGIQEETRAKELEKTTEQILAKDDFKEAETPEEKDSEGTVESAPEASTEEAASTEPKAPSTTLAEERSSGDTDSASSQAGDDAENKA